MSERLVQIFKSFTVFFFSLISSKVEYREINLFWKTGWMGEREREAWKRIKIVSFASTQTTGLTLRRFCIRSSAEIKAEKAAVIITGWVRTQKRSAWAGLSPKYPPAHSADEGIFISASFVPSSAYGDYRNTAIRQEFYWEPSLVYVSMPEVWAHSWYIHLPGRMVCMVCGVEGQSKNLIYCN